MEGEGWRKLRNWAVVSSSYLLVRVLISMFANTTKDCMHAYVLLQLHVRIPRCRTSQVGPPYAHYHQQRQRQHFDPTSVTALGTTMTPTTFAPHRCSPVFQGEATLTSTAVAIIFNNNDTSSRSFSTSASTTLPATSLLLYPSLSNTKATTQMIQEFERGRIEKQGSRLWILGGLGEGRWHGFIVANDEILLSSNFERWTRCAFRRLLPLLRTERTEISLL